MTVNSYLTNLASNAIIRDAEKKSIATSIATIGTRLNAHFPGELSEHFIFGSYKRGTILPRHMDERSDIDYMVVFREGGFRPQTYMDRLRRFVNRYYGSSEISQSNPTIVLSLNHIKFELVPAINQFWYGLRIPARASEMQDWIETDPTDFNQTLVDANRSNNNLIKPLVRLMKYWNAQNGYVYASYDLEKSVAGRTYWGLGGMFTPAVLEDYFYDYVDSMSVGWGESQNKRDRVTRLKDTVREAKLYHELGHEESAEAKIRRVLPPVSALSLGLRELA